MGSETASELVSMAQSCHCRTYRKGWVHWQLPHSHVHLTGFSFGNAIPSTVSFQIMCAEDGVAWHLAYHSSKKGIPQDTVLPCKRPPGMMKHFRLEILDGELAQNLLRIHGILQST